MRTFPANMLVASLAISDFSMGALTCFLGLTTLATSQYPFSDTACQYQGYMAVTLAVASMQTLALMAVNRHRGHDSWALDLPREAYVAYSFLGTISSALNPMIYGVLNKNFQNEYLKILRCSYCRLKMTVEPFNVENGANKIATALNDNAGKLIICLTVETNQEVDFK
ncbi:melatonin receptor [Desmophyllum pertusum]|uniref:Melatonin receptor n=1 Tax=Desmophyllum pertusum TaxID=174260 RepID=A0A9W9Z2R6_9CNID|nr:melatonin receptor [Desmophyllum pertusum]